MLVVDEMLQPTGAGFMADFSSSDVDFQAWGSLSIRFADDQAAEVEWDSQQEGFGSGSHALSRLARPLLAECGED